MAAPDLAAGFPAATQDQWRSLAERVLAKAGRDGDDPMAALSTADPDGPTLPLYTASDLPDPLPRFVPDAPGWDVRARHNDPDAKRTNVAALTDLERGATSLWLVAGAGGLAVDGLSAALDGVVFDLAPVVLDAGADTALAAAELLRLGGDELHGSLGADPIGAQARTGVAADLGVLAQLSGHARPGLCVATVDGTVYHDAGASDVDELAMTTSVGVAYLRELTDAGLSPEDALAAIEFRYAVADDQFASIAKLRAARRIWARVADLSGATVAQRQHAVTSAAMLTRRDPWVNLLRTTIACFAAAVAGADSITVLPFDDAIGLPDDVARRIARNTQSVLHDESGLGRVLDAAGGSWYVEARTDRIAARAWDAFTAFERAGGALAALDGGALEAAISASRDARADAIAHRRDPLTGVTEFADPDEEPVTRPEAPTRGGGPLTAIRYAAEFERLRDRTDAVDPRPSVYLAAVGPVARNGARVSFATNLFQAAGLRVAVGAPDEYDGARVVCLCGADGDVEDEAVKAVSGASHVWLAGRDEHDGVDGNVYAGCDALAVLTTTLDVLEVPQ